MMGGGIGPPRLTRNVQTLARSAPHLRIPSSVSWHLALIFNDHSLRYCSAYTQDDCPRTVYYRNDLDAIRFKVTRIVLYCIVLQHLDIFAAQSQQAAVKYSGVQKSARKCFCPSSFFKVTHRFFITNDLLSNNLSGKVERYKCLLEFQSFLVFVTSPFCFDDCCGLRLLDPAVHPAHQCRPTVWRSSLGLYRMVSPPVSNVIEVLVELR